MTIFIRLLFLSLVLTSCSDSKSEKDSGKISIDLNKSKQALFSEKFVGIEYTLLDIPEEVPFARPFKFQFTKDRIYIEDREKSNLLVFDRGGDYLDIISSSGVGPGEFYSMEDFNVTDSGVYILDKYLNKILAFDPNGNFLNEFRPEFSSNNFYAGDDYFLHYFANNPSVENFNFVKDSGKDWKGYLPIKPGFDGLRYSSINGFMYDSHRDQVVFQLNTSYEAVIFDSKGNLVRNPVFDFGRYTFPDDKRISLTMHPDKYAYLEEHNMVETISCFLPFKDQYFMMVSRQGTMPTYVFLNDDFEVILQSDQFENDLDGMPLNMMPWTYTENQIIFLISSSGFHKEYLRSFPEEQPKRKGKVHDFFIENETKLLEDKYVLIALRLKSITPK